MSEPRSNSHFNDPAKTNVGANQTGQASGKPAAHAGKLGVNTQQYFQWQQDRAYYTESAERPSLLSFLRTWLSQRDWHTHKGPYILDVGCGRGWLAKQLKLVFPQAQVDGIEINRQACEEAREACASLFTQPVEDFLTGGRLHHQYDYIILADVLEHLVDPWAVLKQVKTGLNEQGRIIVSLPNVGHYSVIANLLLGRWPYTDSGLLDRTHLRFFTLQEALQMFHDAGLIPIEVKFTSVSEPEIIDQLVPVVSALGADPERFRQETQAFEYVFLLSVTQAGPNL